MALILKVDKMKNRYLLSRAAVAVALLMGSTHAMAETQSVAGTATVITPISLSQITPFNFGSIVPGTTGGTVILSTSSARTKSGGTVLGNGTTPTAAVVRVTGSGTSTFAVSFSTGTTLTDGATGSMTVDTYVMKSGAGADQTTGYNGTLASGSQDLTIGATLNVDTATANPAGTYSTASAGGVPLTVTVDYN